MTNSGTEIAFFPFCIWLSIIECNARTHTLICFYGLFLSASLQISPSTARRKETLPRMPLHFRWLEYIPNALVQILHSEIKLEEYVNCTTKQCCCTTNIQNKDIYRPSMIYTTATTKALKVEFILGLLVQLHTNQTDVVLDRLKHLPHFFLNDKLKKWLCLIC